MGLTTPLVLFETFGAVTREGCCNDILKDIEKGEFLKNEEGVQLSMQNWLFNKIGVMLCTAVSTCKGMTRYRIRLDLSLSHCCSQFLLLCTNKVYLNFQCCSFS